MARVRMIFSKRGRACFVPHVEMPALFCRSLRRAGARVQLTEGMSPRPKISLGPALPVGVPALAEPLEVWIENWEDNIGEAVNRCLPGGVDVLRYGVVEGRPGSKSAPPPSTVFFRDPRAFERAKAMVSDGGYPSKGPWELRPPRVGGCGGGIAGQVGGGTIVKCLVGEGLVALV